MQIRLNSDILRAGLLAALPIMAGYTVLGIPCGILGAQAGLDALQIALLSLLFYSGAGQYMIPNMWMASSPLATIALSVSLVNSRQILYAASLSRYLQNTSKRLSLLFAATITDESFGVNLKQLNSAVGWGIPQSTIVNLCSWLAWIVATVFGALMGALFSVPAALASFAMTSIFICLLCMQTPTQGNLVAAAVAIFSVILCKLAGFSGPAIFIGASTGVLAALCASRFRNRRMP